MFLLGTCLWFVSCLGSSQELAARPLPSTSIRPEMITVVVALDGVRWREVFEGVEPERAARLGLRVDAAGELMPSLHRLMETRGCSLGSPASPAPITASGPNFVSLPGYTELFTGMAPVDCPDNECGRVRVSTLADQAAELSALPEQVAVISSWPKIERAAARTPERMVISAGRTGGANLDKLRGRKPLERAYRRGCDADPAPGWGDFRPDRYTADLALDYLDEVRPRFLFVGLGETDEYAHHNDYRHYLQALRHADTVVGQLYQRLERAERQGARTLLLVTSDHGRQDFVHHGADYPKSARTWLVAAGSEISARGYVVSPAPRRLADLAPTVRSLWGLAPAYGAAERRPGAVLTELFRGL